MKAWESVGEGVWGREWDYSGEKEELNLCTLHWSSLPASEHPPSSRGPYLGEHTVSQLLLISQATDGAAAGAVGRTRGWGA